ncbi:MAG: autotransporter-associated beta strand repeat-containing protein [Opitutaceae bacterium]
MYIRNIICHFRYFYTLAISLAAALVTPLGAASFTWDGGGANDNFSTPENWVGDIAPSTSGDDLVFTGNTRLTPSAEQPYSVNSISFSNGAGSFSLGGSTLTIGTGDIINSSNTTQTINNALTLAVSPVFLSSPSGNTIYNGNIDTNGKDLRSNVGNGDTQTFNGIISGSGRVYAQGIGVTTIGSSGQTFTGGFQILAQAEIGGSDSYLGNGDLIFSSGKLTVNGTANISRPITLNSSGGTLIAGSGSPFFTGLISGTGQLAIGGGNVRLTNNSNSYTGTTTINNGATLRISDRDQISSDDLIFDNGSLQLLANLIISNQITINAGGGTFDTNGFTLDYFESMTGLGQLTKTGAGVLTFVDQSDFLAGSTSVMEGTLVFRGNNFSTGDFHVESGATFSLTNSFFSKPSIGVNALTGSGTINLVATNNEFFLGANNSSQAVDILFTGAGVLNKQGTGTITLNRDNDVDTITASGGTLVLGGDHTGVSTLNLDSSLLRIAGPISFSGDINLLADSTIDFQSPLTFSGNLYTNSNTLTKEGPAEWTISSAATIEFSTQLVIDEGTVRLEDVASPSLFLTNNGNLHLDYDTNKSGVIFDLSGAPSTGSLTKTGTGTFTFSDASVHHTGGTSVMAGTLNFSGGQTPSGDLHVESGATVNIEGNSPTSTTMSAAALTGTGTINLNFFDNEFFLGANDSTQVVDILFTGDGVLNKQGTGTLILNRANTVDTIAADDGTLVLAGDHTAVSTVKLTDTSLFAPDSADDLPGKFELGSGLLRIAAPLNFSGDIMLIDDSTIDFQSPLIFSGELYTDSNTLTKEGPAEWTFSSATFLESGAQLVIDEGTVRLEDVSATLLLTNNGSLILDYDTNEGGVIYPLNGDPGTGSLTKTGTGIFFFADAQVLHTGGTFVMAGTLDFTWGQTPPGDLHVETGATLSITGGNPSGGTTSMSATALTGSGTIDLKAIDSEFFLGANDSTQAVDVLFTGDGVLNKQGTGTLTLNRDNDVDTIAAEDGTLVLAGDHTAVSTVKLTDTSLFAPDSADDLPGQFDLGSGILRIAAPLSFSGDIFLLGDATIDFQSPLTFSGNLDTKSNTLTKDGPAEWTFASAATMENPTALIIDEGTVRLQEIPFFNLSLTNNGSLILDYNTNTSGVIFSTGGDPGTGSLTKTGTGTFTVADSNGLQSGGTSVMAGTLNFSGGQTPSGDLHVESGATVNIAGGLPTATTMSATALTGTGTINLDFFDNEFYLGANDSTQAVDVLFTGGGVLNKLGTGTLTLNRDNTVDTISASDGTLVLAGDHTGVPIVRLLGTSLFAPDSADDLPVQFDLGSGILRIAAPLSFSGDINLIDDATIDFQSPLTFSGNLTQNSNALTKGGPAELLITSAASLDSPAELVIDEGTLRLKDLSNFNLLLANNGSLVLDYNIDTGGVIQDNDSYGSLTKTGTGTFTFFDSNVIHVGGTSVMAGTLSFIGGQPPAADLHVETGATLKISDGISSGTSMVVAALTGSGTIDLDAPGNEFQFNNFGLSQVVDILFTGGGDIYKDGPETLTLNRDNTVATIIAAEGTLVLEGDHTGVSTVWLVGSGGLFAPDSADDLPGRFKLGSGTLRIAAPLSFSGDIDLIGDAFIDFQFPLTFSGNLDTDSGTLTKGGPAEWIFSSTATMENSTQLVINEGTVRLQDVTGTSLFLTNNGSLHLDYDTNKSGFIDTLNGDPSTGSLTKTGTGTFSFTDSNVPNTGGTSVMAGTLGFFGGQTPSGDLHVETGATLNIVDNIISGTSIAADALTGSGTINLDGFDNRCYIGADDSTQAVDVLFTGGGEVNKQGTGTLTLNRDNTVATIAASDGTLVLAGNHTAVSTVRLTGTSLFTPTAANQFPAEVFLNGGTLEPSSPLTYAGNITLGGAGTIQASADFTFSGLLNGNASPLDFSGPATTTLTSSGPLSGTVNVSSGTLQVSNSTNSATGSADVNISSTGRVTGTGSVSGAVTVTGGGSLAPGNSPGSLGVGDLQWGNPGCLEMEIQDSNGTPGNDWDHIQAESLTLLPIDSFVIKLQSLTGSGTSGPLDNFHPSSATNWTFLSTNNGISGFDALNFTIDTSSFIHSVSADNFSVSLVNGGFDLQLNYTPSGFDAWLNLYFTPAELLDPSISGPLANPDGDTLSNLEEYAYGGDPKSNDSSAAPSFEIDDTTFGDEYLTITFTRLHDRTDLIYRVFATGNLTAFTPVAESILGGPVNPLHGGGVQVTPDPIEMFRESVIVRDAVKVSDADRRFMYIEIIRP